MQSKTIEVEHQDTMRMAVDAILSGARLHIEENGQIASGFVTKLERHTPRFLSVTLAE